MRVIVRSQIMRGMGVIVRLESVVDVLVFMLATWAMLVRVGMLMDVFVRMLVDVLMRVRDRAMTMFMPMAVQMRMVVTVTVFVISVHCGLPPGLALARAQYAITRRQHRGRQDG